jgi:FixJ family two-component response regulator/two-component sensor histidine kinase
MPTRPGAQPVAAPHDEPGAPAGSGVTDRRAAESAGAAPRRIELASLSDFAAGIAHEINNPLAIIIEAAGWVEDLLEDEGKQSRNLDEMRRALRQIVTQAGRCRDITHNLLSFANRVPGKLDDVRLHDLLREVVATLEKRAASRRVTIALHLDPAVPTQHLSPTEIQQVLVNLIANAIDALEPKGGRIDVTMRGAGGETLIDVADDGAGIPDEILPRIFDPFFTTKPVGKGTGLGLAICYGIMKNLGGSITVESRAGSGTTFHLRFPEHPAGGERQPGRVALEEDEGAFGPSPQVPTTVLVADDEEGFAEMLGKRMARRNITVLTAASGAETLARLQANPAVDVVVLDLKMPDMEGTEVLAEIKRAAPLVEVILLSGHTTVESAIEGMRLGAFDYLVKPCELSVLVAQIERARARKLRQEERIMEARLREITMRRL